METRQIFIVYTNTDLTEGRGRCIPKHYCLTEETAQRLAKGAGVQGSNASVVESKAFYENHTWYAPILTPEPPSNEDMNEARRNKAIEEVLNKARTVLTDEEIAMLKV